MHLPRAGARRSPPRRSDRPILGGPFESTGGFQPAGFRARDGMLWFPTSDGVAVVNPTLVPVNETPPPMVIESCLLDRESVECRDGLRIEPHQEVVEIAYTGLSFISPAQMRFRYKIQGLDREWVEAGDRRTAYYSHLPPGHYTFTVMGANSDGIWNPTGASMAITVVPPFWRTWWFTGAGRAERHDQCRRNRLGCVDVSGRAAAAHRQAAGGVRAPVDHLAGGRAGAHRRRAARQPRPASGDHPQLVGARRPAAGSRGASASEARLDHDDRLAGDRRSAPDCPQPRAVSSRAARSRRHRSPT